MVLLSSLECGERRENSMRVALLLKCRQPRRAAGDGTLGDSMLEAFIELNSLDERCSENLRALGSKIRCTKGV